VKDLRFPRLWLIGGWIAVVAALIVCLVPGKYVEVANINDKIEHAAGFGLLVLWFCGMYLRSRYWRIAVYFVLFGALIEILQGLMNWGRHADIFDLLADSVGIAMGVLVALTPIGNWPRWLEALIPKR
jgi:VanZ family protein